MQGHGWFCLTQVNELIDLFNSIKTPADSMALKNRLSCYHFLLVHMLKVRTENFLIVAHLMHVYSGFKTLNFWFLVRFYDVDHG